MDETTLPAPPSLEIDDCWNRIGIWGAHDLRCPRLEQLGHCRNCPLYSETGRKLLDRPFPPNYRQELDRTFAKDLSKQKQVKNSAFVFRAGAEWLALPAYLIQEVVDMGPIHTLPHRSSRIFRGIVNIRGKLELCVSIGGVLRIEPHRRAKADCLTPERLVVASKEGQDLVFPVSEVLGIVHYQPEMLQELPITVSGSKAVYTRGILCLPDRDVGFLDYQLLFRILTRNLA